MPASDDTTYRWSRGIGSRIFGGVVIGLAAVWALSAALGFPAWSLVMLAAGTALALAALLRLVVFPLPLLLLTREGYRLRAVRGGGVPTASWPDVESIATDAGPSGAVMVIRLTDGRSTTVPISLLGARARAAERDVHERLNTAFGYRRLDDG